MDLMVTKYISLWQPWAYLYAVGIKKVETRSWGCIHRGPLAIHATLTWNDDCRAAIHNDLIMEALLGSPAFADIGGPDWRGGDDWDEKVKGRLTFGAIIGVVNMADCRPYDAPFRMGVFEAHPELDTPRERALGLYERKRYGLVAENARLLPQPIPYKGRQGLIIDLEPEASSRIEELLA
jgi:activating signal cointegrator 1